MTQYALEETTLRTMMEESPLVPTTTNKGLTSKCVQAKKQMHKIYFGTETVKSPTQNFETLVKIRYSFVIYYNLLHSESLLN